jgi:aminoglycoside 6'-N-acetyltransferase I
MRHVVRRARIEDRDQLAQLCALLWPKGSLEEHRTGMDALLSAGRYGTMPAAVFAAELENGTLGGFLEVGLRSHADGCDPQSPVAFVEGWFVREELRGHGVGGELMRAAGEWARGQRCREMASDALIGNQGSIDAHAAMGFEEVDRCVHFRKAI